MLRTMVFSLPNFYVLWWLNECWRYWVIVCRRVKCCVCFLNVWRVMLLTMACSLPNFYFLRWLQECWRCWMIVGEWNVAFVFFNVRRIIFVVSFVFWLKKGLMTSVVLICVDVITVSDIIIEHSRRWPLNF